MDSVTNRPSRFQDRRAALPNEAGQSVLFKANSGCRIRLIARHGVLRIPSELVGLKWSDISRDRKRFTVNSPKTEHHQGHESRVVPLLLAIETELMKLFTEPAPEGSDDRIFPDITPDTNLRTTLKKMIRRAGVKQWPKLWHTLRASGATDFARSLPSHVATAICGHTEEVAREHYWTRSHPRGMR